MYGQRAIHLMVDCLAVSAGILIAMPFFMALAAPFVGGM